MHLSSLGWAWVIRWFQWSPQTGSVSPPAELRRWASLADSLWTLLCPTRNESRLGLSGAEGSCLVLRFAAALVLLWFRSCVHGRGGGGLETLASGPTLLIALAYVSRPSQKATGSTGAAPRTRAQVLDSQTGRCAVLGALVGCGGGPLTSLHSLNSPLYEPVRLGARIDLSCV